MFLTDVYNCSNYFICINQRPIAQTCERNLNFNAETQSCEANSAQCISNQCVANNLTVLPFHKTCNKYVICFNGQPLVQQCAENLQFNKKINKCDLPANVDCVADKCPVQNNINDIIYTPSAINCSVFYVCMAGTQYKTSCAKGLLFNPEINHCDYAANVTCNVLKTRTTSILIDEMPAETAVSFDCPPEGTHFFKHYQPNQYYVCADGKANLLNCPEGLIFDELVHECRFPNLNIEPQTTFTVETPIESV